MGAAACKNSKSALPNQSKDDNKNITIGVFGLDDAGKTSAVKVIEGASTKNVVPTVGFISTTVTNPLSNEKNDRNDKNKNQQRIKIIDVSGQKKYRQQSWSQYYDQIHGLIFVIDASESDRLSENQETLEDLLKNEKLKDKPILILANKQDQRGAISSERDLKRELEIERLKTKHKIELCTASPRNPKTKADDSIRKGFSWLIRTIDDNYTSLNARVAKAKNAPITKRFNRSESDDSDNKYSKDKIRSRITSEKLPSINKNTFKAHSDDDDIYPSSKNEFNKKKLGGTNTNDRSIKKSNDNEPKAFRSTYEPFPEETPWSSSSILKTTKSDDTLPRLYAKPPLSSDTKRRGLSPLVHDTKSYTNGSTFKRDNNSDGEDDFMRQQKLKTTSRFDSSPYTTNRFTTNTKKTTGSIYDDDNINTRRITSASKKTYNDYDDDDDIYPKKSSTTTTVTTTATRFNKNYDFDENKTYPRSNLNSDYRGTLSKPGNQFKYDNNNRSSTYPKKETQSRFDDDDDDDDYATSKSKNRSKYSDDDDDDRWSPSKTTTTTTNSRYDKDDYHTSSSKFNTRPLSSSKPISHSKFEDDDDYPSSKPATRSNYNNNPSKSTGHSRFDDDDDDDDYPSSTKKNNYPSSYGSRATGSRYDDDDFYNN